MEVPGSRWAAILLAAATLATGLPAGVAVADGPDPGIQPRHDILAANVTATAEEVRFNVRMDGPVPAPEDGSEEFVVEFGVASQDTTRAGVGEATTRYKIAYGSENNPAPYFLFQNLTAVSVGSELEEQPPHGTPEVTFSVQRDNLQGLPAREPQDGARVVDVRIRYLHDGDPTDQVEPNGTVLPGPPAEATLRLHLAGHGDRPFVHRTLEDPAPDAGPSRIAVVSTGEGGERTWTSEPLERPFTIESGRADLWLSFTATTPLAAASVVDVQLQVVLPDGSSRELARREDLARPDSPSDPNVFTTPGEPHKVHWPLAFEGTRVPAGAQLQLAVEAEGSLSLGDAGPAAVHYDSARFDSQLLLAGENGTEPTIPRTDPALGERTYHLRGRSGFMTRASPPEGPAEAVPAAGNANATPAVWRSDELQRRLGLEDASVTVWLSETTSAAGAAAGIVDVELFAVGEGQRSLVADRAAAGNDRFLFTNPGRPTPFVFDLEIHRDTLPAGTELELAVTSNFADGPRPVLAWSNSPDADSRLNLDAREATASATPESVATDEAVNLSGRVLAGGPPWTVHWDFGDGNRTAERTTFEPVVSATHAYERAGTYEPTLVVRDRDGAAGGAGARVEVLADPGDQPVGIHDVAADPHLPRLGTLAVTWATETPGNSTVHYGTSPDNLDASVTVEEDTVNHEVVLENLRTATTYFLQVETDGERSAVLEATTAGDFTGDSHTVVAYVDSGINPYHERFRRPARTAHPATYVDGFPADAQPLDLSLEAPTYADALASDADAFAAVEEDRLRWIPGTNVVAAVDQGDAAALNGAPDATPILDDDGHGTAVAGTLTRANPDVLLAVVEGPIGDGFRWAADRPWVDIVSVSVASAFPSPGEEAPDAYDRALASGKLVVFAAGNTPNHDVVFPPPSYPQTISVGGAHPDVHGTEPAASKTPDVVSNFTVRAPSHASRTETDTASGTSFAAPNVAGTLSATVLDLRRAAGDASEAPGDGLAPLAPGGPYADDGRLSNLELWDALNRTAEYWNATQWTPSATLPVATEAPWVQMGWGFVGPSLRDDLVRTVAGEADPAKSEEALAWMAADEAVHRGYHGGPGSATAP